MISKCLWSILFLLGLSPSESLLPLLFNLTSIPSPLPTQPLPSHEPTQTRKPSSLPTQYPSVHATPQPSLVPTLEPSETPINIPTPLPSNTPRPSLSPTTATLPPTLSHKPTPYPTHSSVPSSLPTTSPTLNRISEVMYLFHMLILFSSL
jgi:hypothetical protein